MTNIPLYHCHSNLTTLATYSGSLDESWFYLTTTAIESAGSKCPAAILSSISHIRDGNYDGLKLDLTTVRDALADINTVLHRMFEKCDPYVFYWKIRPYLAGWENMAEAGLPLGLIYEGVDSLWSAETDEYADISHLDEGERLLRQYRRYAGGSAAQSSLIATFDVAFGVEHHPVGEKPTSSTLASPLAMRLNQSATSPVDKNDRYRHLPSTRPADELDHSETSSGATTPLPSYKRTNRNSFLRAMRKYMPEKHRLFLEDLETAANIRPFMMHLEALLHTGEISDEERELIGLYNDCLHQLKLFRDKHVQIVSLYIVNQARKGPNIAHGGFAMEKKKGEDTTTTTTATNSTPSATTQLQDQEITKKKALHNMLYPQTALETHPGIREGSPSAKVSSLFPQLGLAKHVDPKTGVVRGTGGTNVMPFLKQSRDETADMKISLEVGGQQPQALNEESVDSKSWTDMLLRR